MRINRQTYYHTQEIVIPVGTGGLTRKQIKLPKEEFDLITGFGIISTLNTKNENYKLGLASNSKEFINLVHHSFFSISPEVAPKERLMPVLFKYERDNRIDCRIQLISAKTVSEIKLDIVVRVEHSRHYKPYQAVSANMNHAIDLPSNLDQPTV